MELTLAQLDHIDDYLLKNKVTYWDVRMELLDHIAMEVQQRMQKGVTFEHALQEVHLAFGNNMRSKKLSKDQTQWIFTESIYADQSGYKKIIAAKMKELQLRKMRFYRKRYFGFFTAAPSLCFYVASLGLLVFWRESINPKMLSQLVMGVVLFAVIPPILKMGWHRMRYGHSLALLVFWQNFMLTSYGFLIMYMFLYEKIFLEPIVKYGFWFNLLLLMWLIPLIVVQSQVYRDYLHPLGTLKRRWHEAH